MTCTNCINGHCRGLGFLLLKFSFKLHFSNSPVFQTAPTAPFTLVGDWIVFSTVLKAVLFMRSITHTTEESTVFEFLVWIGLPLSSKRRMHADGRHTLSSHAIRETDSWNFHSPRLSGQEKIKAFYSRYTSGKPSTRNIVCSFLKYLSFRIKLVEHFKVWWLSIWLVKIM